MSRQRLQLAIIAAIVVAGDILSKRLAVAYLPPSGIPHEVVGEYLRFTLAFNRGAAFGMHVGGWSRVVFSAFALAMVAVLLYAAGRVASHAQRLIAAMGLVAGGALGNLLDRIRWDRGVVDFIDVGVGLSRFWVFNLADSAITVGAILLLWPTPAEHPASAPEPGAPGAPGHA
ncbi:MAG: signal peptidase II [Gemmatimonadetes bacterium]|nr:signal peptidase II [Gemmatimonadota bacterium]